MDVRFTVNGEPRNLSVEPRWTLGDVLRERLGLTGTHLACEHGVCGACTVEVDGEAVRSCLLFAVQCEGTDVVTVEGLRGPSGELHPLQVAFARENALQCGFCTPGFLMLAHAALESDPAIADDEARLTELLTSNLCRCTGYEGIRRAVRSAAHAQAGAESS
jgi:carbon-monoxide dehydrogenase small subunit